MVVRPPDAASPQPVKSSAESALPSANLTTDPSACDAAVVPEWPLVQLVRSLLDTPPTRISSSPIRTT